MDSIADGTYTYTLTGAVGGGIEITATVQRGCVTGWTRNGLAAYPEELACIDFTALLRAELATRARLGRLLRPVDFVAAQEVAA